MGNEASRRSTHRTQQDARGRARRKRHHLRLCNPMLLAFPRSLGSLNCVRHPFWHRDSRSLYRLVQLLISGSSTNGPHQMLRLLCCLVPPHGNNQLASYAAQPRHHGCLHRGQRPYMHLSRMPFQINGKRRFRNGQSHLEPSTIRAFPIL